MKINRLNSSLSLANIVDAWAIFLLALVPFIFNFLAVTSLDLVKAVFFQAGVTVFCLLVACQFIVSKIKLRLGKSLVPVVFLVLFLISSLIFSVDFAQSWWGSYTRQLGAFTYISGLLGAFAFLVSFSLSPKEERRNRYRRYFLGITIIATLISIYALLQLFGLDIVRWAEPAKQTGRAFASLGQPTYLAGFLLLTIPIAAAFVFIFSSKRRYFFLVPLILQLLGLLATGTRSSFLALGLALLILLFVKIFQQSRKNNQQLIKKIILSFLGVLLLFVSLAFSNPKRWQELGDLKSGSLGLRSELWREGFLAIKKRPWFGYGLENQREAYIYQYDVQLMRYLHPDVSSDRAHNLILDSVLTAGLIGSFFALFFVISLLNYYRRLPESERPLARTLLFSGGVYFLFLFFNFSVVTTFFYSGLLLVIFLSLGLPSAEERKTKLPGRFLPLLVLIPFAFGMAIFSEERLSADYYYHAALNSLNQGDYFKAVVLDSYAQEKKIDSVAARQYQQNFTWAIIDHLIFNDLPLADKHVLLERINSSPINENLQTFDQRLFTALILGFNGEKERAQLELTELITAVPALPKTFLVLGDLNWYNKDFLAAQKNWQLAAKLIPDFDSTWDENQRGRLVRYQDLLKARQARALVNQ